MKLNRYATYVGLSAIFLWASIVGLIRTVTEEMGAVAGAASIYSLGAVLLLIIFGIPRIQQCSKPYLFWSSLLFVSYEICLSLSVGYASDAKEAIEVSMLNYLWPSLTIAFSVIFNKQLAKKWLWLGLFISFLGMIWVLGAETGLNWHHMMGNVLKNPISYILALLGAVIWAVYCTITVRYAEGQNLVTWFFALTALALWLQFYLVDSAVFVMPKVVIWPLLMASAAMALGYGAWNFGILYGNVTILACASYFIPVLSAALASWYLDTALSIGFWQGVAMICFGSLICWFATRNNA